MESQNSPRKALPRMRAYHCQSRRFPDHSGNPVTSVVHGADRVDCYKVGLQLYPLAPLKDSPEKIGDGFTKLDFGGNAHNKWPRVDIYSPQDSIEACMRHQLLERKHRREDQGASRGPHMVTTWAGGYMDYQYRNVILVADKDSVDWESIKAKGLTAVLFDWTGDPADDIDVIDAEDSEVKDLQYVECSPASPDPLIFHVVVDPAAEKEVEERQRRSPRRKDDSRPLSRLVWDLCAPLPQCCYDGHADCLDCEAEIAHEACRLDE